VDERGLTRRQALARISLAGAGVWLAGCGAGAPRPPSPSGSTLSSTYVDPGGDGVLTVATGAPLTDRHDLAPAAALGTVLATIAHLTDAHVMDSQSPARVPFLRRLGPPFNSTFRPQEALTAHVLAGALAAVEELRPDAVIEGGDLIDNAQGNELEQALALLAGGVVDPGSGGPGYLGVQSAADPDPLYYRPDIDAPRHPGMLAAATRRFRAPGLAVIPWYPVLGDHDTLVQGVLPPDPQTQSFALGRRAIWDLPPNLQSTAGIAAGAAVTAGAGSSPDALGAPGAIGELLALTRAAPAVTVPADAARRELAVPEVLARLRGVSRAGGAGPLLDYSFDIGERVRVIVLDLVRREGGSGGVVQPRQPRWLADELARTGERWVIVACHQPLTSSAGGETLLALLDRHPRVLAAIWGHTHRNRVVPRASPAGGYWLVASSSLIDFPQELRAMRVRETAGGGVALEAWMLDHVPDGGLGDISRQLSYLDAQGGRPQGFAGGPLDRNVRLYKRAPRA